MHQPGPGRDAEPLERTLQRPEAEPPGGAPDGPAYLPTVLAIFGFVVIGWTMLRSLRKRAARPSSMAEPPRERIEKLREEAAARASVESVMADAVELRQRLAAQLDSKAAMLERLIAEADDRLARLRSQPGGAPTPESPSRPQSDPLRHEIYRLADEGLDPLEIAQRVDQPRGHVELTLALRRA